MSRIINNKKSFRRYFFIFILCLTGIFLSNTIGYAAPVPVLNYFTCDSSIGSGVANWPTYTYGWTCHASVTMPTDNGTVPKFDLTFKTNDNKATATPGYHGSDVTYTTLNRFRVTYSSAVNMNGATAVVSANAVQLSKGSTQVYNFTFNYDTFEADLGGTPYSIKGLTINLKNNADTTIWGTITYSPDFTYTVQNKAYLDLTANPSIALTQAQTKNLSQYWDTTTPITVRVRANNSWKLQTELSGAPTSGSYSIPITSNYFSTSQTGSGCSLLTSGRTQYSTSYIDIARNNSGIYTTGSTDSKNLSYQDITFTPSLYTSSLFTFANYTTSSYFNLISP